MGLMKTVSKIRTHARMRTGLSLLALCAGLSAPVAASAITVSMPYRTVTQEAAEAMVAVCTKWASDNKLMVAIAVVDAAGNTVASGRMDGASVITTQMAPWKARTAVRWRRPSSWVRDAVKAGRREGVWLGDVAVQGGLPFLQDNKAFGAIGVGGGTNQQDEDCGRYAIEKVIGAKAAEDAVKGIAMPGAPPAATPAPAPVQH